MSMKIECDAYIEHAVLESSSNSPDILFSLLIALISFHFQDKSLMLKSWNLQSLT